jgi:endonuclease III
MVNLVLPNINDVLQQMSNANFSFDSHQGPIHEWLRRHRETIRNNQQLLVHRSEENDIEILLSILRDLLIRATRGERGNKVYEELKKTVKSKKDLTEQSYKTLLSRAQYRWGIQTGSQVISDVVNLFGIKLKWNWSEYFDAAEQYHETNFQQDELLKIKHIGYKVRDLALSNFNENYIANDLHVVRVMTRIGLLNYGFDLIFDSSLEMGNNPGNTKNYLFLHRLVLKLSRLTSPPYLPADIDRVFWAFGKSRCGNRPECRLCPVKKLCLTGKN